MEFPDPLVRARLLRRYKRFLADVAFDDPADPSGDDAPVTVHCPNPGGMIGLAAAGAEVWLSPARNPKRKLRWTYELERVGDHLVGINTAHPNAIAAEAIAAGAIAPLAGYDTVRREVPYGRNSRIDLLLEGGGRPPCYVEVKNVHLARDEADGRRLAAFPDAVTVRGAKHLVELGDMVEAGCRAVMLYLVQRGDCAAFTTAADIDPAYDERLGEALARGVEAICYDCSVTCEAIVLGRPVPIDLSDGAARRRKA